MSAKKLGSKQNQCVADRLQGLLTFSHHRSYTNSICGHGLQVSGTAFCPVLLLLARKFMQKSNYFSHLNTY